MATITLYNGTNMTLTGMIDYIASNKEHNNLVLDYYAKGADPFRAARDMLNVKKYYDKTGGNEYIQMVLSLEEAEVDDEEDIQHFNMVVRNVADMLFDRYKCQIAYAVHGNTDNLHAHYVLNSVRYVDGYKLQIGPDELCQLKDLVSGILTLYGFKIIRRFKEHNVSPNYQLDL